MPKENSTIARPHSERAYGYVAGQIGALSVFFGVPLLFLPKINIFNIAGETAGVRIDDLVLASVLGLLMAAFIYLRRAYITGVEATLCIFIISGVLSCALEGGSIIYAFRVLEYFTFFYIGVHAARYFHLQNILLAFIGWNAILIFLQALGVVGAFPLGNYELGAPIGIGSGNWEIGILLNIAWVPLAFGEHRKLMISTVTGLLIFGLHFLIGSRAPAATFVAIFVCFVLWNLRRKVGIILLMLPVIALGIVVFYQIVGTSLASSKLLMRASSLSTTDYQEVLTRLWRITPERGEFISYDEANKVAARFASSDLSLLERAQKSISALKFYFQSSWLAWLIGTGPGRFGVAIDEGYARLLAETGIVGVASFCVFLYKSLEKSAAVWFLLGIFFFSMLTLDAYLSYKIMALLLFIGGITTGQELNLKRFSSYAGDSHQENTSGVGSAV
jgi:hypothetical protein